MLAIAHSYLNCNLRHFQLNFGGAETQSLLHLFIINILKQTPFMETYFIFCLILLTSVVEMHSEEKAAHIGESVLLFPNVTADSPDNEVHLYINGVKNYTLIATWIFKNERFTMVPNSYFNILMDAARNIWIHNVDETYTGKYSLYNSSRPAIELIILGNSQIKSESPSQNTMLWIGSSALVALVIVASAFFIYVAHTRKWGMRIRTCYQHWKRKHPARERSREELQRLVEEALRDDYKRVMGRLEALEKVEEAKRDDYKRAIERLEALEKVNETLRDDLKHVIERLVDLEKEKMGKMKNIIECMNINNLRSFPSYIDHPDPHTFRNKNSDRELDCSKPEANNIATETHTSMPDTLYTNNLDST